MAPIIAVSIRSPFGATIQKHRAYLLHLFISVLITVCPRYRAHIFFLLFMRETICLRPSTIYGMFRSFSGRRILNCSNFFVSTRRTSNSSNLVWWWRDPFVRLPRSNLFNVHGINLLQGPTLTFNDKEVDQKATKEVASSKNVSITKINGGSNEGCEKCYRTELAFRTYLPDGY